MISGIKLPELEEILVGDPIINTQVPIELRQVAYSFVGFGATYARGYIDSAKRIFPASPSANRLDITLMNPSEEIGLMKMIFMDPMIPIDELDCPHFYEEQYILVAEFKAPNFVKICFNVQINNQRILITHSEGLDPWWISKVRNVFMKNPDLRQPPMQLLLRNEVYELVPPEERRDLPVLTRHYPRLEELPDFFLTRWSEGEETNLTRILKSEIERRKNLPPMSKVTSLRSTT